ncbi:MAG: hypothetical protein A2147_03130 [Chloroflexi bacterium RBG_16_57_8]|nr:MAG: hypothetical protein A2147_03130 [Chloroflexi bacterium RBG_16_57_8]
MPLEYGDQQYYRTAEVCRMVGMSRATLLRWMQCRVIRDAKRDRRGWRLFSRADVEDIRKEAYRIR